MHYKQTKSDWKLFHEKLPEWQDTYMNRLIAEKDITVDDLSEFSDELQTEVKARIDS